MNNYINIVLFQSLFARGTYVLLDFVSFTYGGLIDANQLRVAARPLQAILPVSKVGLSELQ